MILACSMVSSTVMWTLSPIMSFAVIMESPSSAAVARAFANHWIRWAGAPRQVHHDQGGEIQRDFEQLMEKLNAQTFVTASDSAWQHGMTERHGGILKTIVRHVVDDNSSAGRDDMEDAVLAALLAKNQLTSVHGFSPIQHVLGQDISLPASVLNAPGELASHSWALADGPFQRSLALRESARKAWIRMDNSSKLRRALVSKSRDQTTTFLPGMQVYFWRRGGQFKTGGAAFKGKYRKDPERWVGPALILAVEGSRAIWISYRMALLKVSPEHVRVATAEENMSQRYVLEQMNELNMQMHEPRGQALFYDLTGGQPQPPAMDEVNVPLPAAAPPPEAGAETPNANAPVGGLGFGREPDQEPTAAFTPERAMAPAVETADPQPVDVPVPGAAEGQTDPDLEANVLEPMNTKAGRGTRELNARRFSPEERKVFDKSDAKQFQTWLDKDAIEVLSEREAKSVPRDRVLPGRSRIVRTDKAAPGEPLNARSRIVVPGHLDQDLGEFRNDAPTAPQAAIHLLMMLAATWRWVISAFDVEAAFLNGVALKRVLYARPPMDLKGQDPRGLWRLKKAVFGLTEAPRYWWLRIREDLLATGWIELRFLAATFLLYDGDKVVGALVLHVDDGLTAGEGPHYEAAIQALRGRAPLDQWRRQSFDFLGRHVTQLDDYTVEIDQKKYWSKVEPLYLAKHRKKQLEQRLSEEEFVAFRSLVGKLSWPARETMPGLAFGVSELQQHLSGSKATGGTTATVEHALMANRLLKDAKMASASQAALRMCGLNEKELCVVTFSDASFANMPRGGSQAGSISLLSTKAITEGQAKASVVDWTSSRVHRVVKSTLAAEAAALAAAQDRNEFLRVCVAYFFGRMDARRTTATPWQNALQMVPGHLVVDAKSLNDLLEKQGSMPKEKRVGLDLMAVREGLERDEDHLHWICTRWMLADVLTKAKRQDLALEHLLKTGKYGLKVHGFPGESTVKKKDACGAHGERGS